MVNTRIPCQLWIASVWMLYGVHAFGPRLETLRTTSKEIVSSATKRFASKDDLRISLGVCDLDGPSLFEQSLFHDSGFPLGIYDDELLEIWDSNCAGADCNECTIPNHWGSGDETVDVMEFLGVTRIKPLR